MNSSGISHSDATRSFDAKYGKIENNLSGNRREQYAKLGTHDEISTCSS